MKISIIIPTYNGLSFLRNCIPSILKQTYKNFEIIIVDNASTDGSVKFIKKKYHHVSVIQNRINVGFGKANNRGAEKASGEILFFLNNDVILGFDVLEKLTGCRLRKKLNILGPKILDFQANDIYQGRNLSIDCTGYIGNGKKTFYIDGCALMIPKKDFMKIGGFDDSYFMYSEDIDLCWRAHLYGMKVGVCNIAKVRHIGGGTGGSTLFHHRGYHEVPIQRRYEVEKNNLRNVLKNYELKNLLWVVPLFELQSLGEWLVYMVTGNFEAVSAVWKAHIWNLINISDTLHKRRLIQQGRTVADGKILTMMFKGLNKLSALRTIGIPKFR